MKMAMACRVDELELNVYPMICPALNNLYHKISGKDKPHMNIWINNDVCADLTWAASHLCNSLRVRLLSSVTWDVEDADKIVCCDACKMGLAFWFPTHHQGFYSQIPCNTVWNIIFYFEALAIAKAINNLRTSAVSTSKIIIHTDGMNTVNIFNSLWCLPEFNPLLWYCINIFMNKKFDVHILHILGVPNVVADVISCHDFQKAVTLVPRLTITLFQPPNLVMRTPSLGVCYCSRAGHWCQHMEKLQIHS